jgi:GNAT superfamily N-acetyltransferase
MTGVAVRSATAADQDATLDLIEELFQPPGVRPRGYTPERAREGVRYCLESSQADILLAEVDGVIVGLATVYVDFPSIRFGVRCYLQDLVVASTSRGEGIGRLLLDAATGWARERGCSHLQLDSGLGRKDAHRFYLANGMEQDAFVFIRGLKREP